MDALLSANLVAWAIQAGVIVIVAAPLPWIFRLWSARVRLAFWRTVFVACLLLPLLQPWQMRPAQTAVVSGPPSVYRVDVVGPGQATAPASGVTSNPPPFAGWSWPRLGAVVILSGIVVRLCWLGLGLVTVTRLRRAAMRMWPRPASVDRAATLAETDAEFLVSPTAVRPVTCGLLWPVVMVPRTFESFPEPEQTAIACHELIHVGRADWARNVIDELLRALLWFHPAIWWLIDQIQLAREQVVDREAVLRLGARQSYLEALLRLARPAPRHVLAPAPLFLKRAHLRQRVTLLVKEAAMSRARLVVSLAVMAFVLFVGGRLVTWAVPLQQAGAAMPGAVVAAKAAPSVQGNPGATASSARPGTPTAVSGAVAGGIPGGIAGGVPGGVTGGVSGGVAGGVAGGIVGSAKNDANEPRRQAGSDPASHTVVNRVDPQPADGLSPVVVRVWVGVNGMVTNAEITTPPSPGDGDAIAAARQWQFAPASEAWITHIGFSFALPPAAAPRMVGGNIKPPAKIRDVKPAYPAEARQAGIQGIQIVEGTINTDGRVVDDAWGLRQQDELISAALGAVLRWQFVPAVVNGEPVPVKMFVTVNFTLESGKP